MSLKLIEVVILICAGALFVAWQLHDVRRARQHTRQQREAQQNPALRQPDRDAQETALQNGAEKPDGR